jgi:tripartite-type tricarboxylate transporter receptor subunit TctC
MWQTHCVARVLTAGLIVFAVHCPAAAQGAAGFYRGKTITLTIGGPVGSDEDIYARLLARYLGKHIPGNPAVVAANMPGGGGHAAASYIYSAAAKDGTAIGAVPPAAVTAPLWFGFDKIPYDPAKLVYLGSAASESTDCFVGSTSVKSLRDALAGPVTMGALAGGGPTSDGPLLLNALLGTKFHVAANYARTGQILSAIERGEIAGACGLTWSSVATRHPDWLPKQVLRGLVQESATGSSLAARLDIPLAVTFAASAEDREVMALAYAQQTFGQPFILPPETPPDRAAALRTAFMDTLADGGLLAAARTASLEIDPLSGEAVARLVGNLYATPPPVLDRVRAAIAGGRAH